jgi:hypothetical protein
VPLAQKPINQMIELMERSTRTQAELMKKALEAAQAPAVEESQAKWKEFWSSSLEATRSNAESFSQIGSKAIVSWTDFIRNGAK